MSRFLKVKTEGYKFKFFGLDSLGKDRAEVNLLREGSFDGWQVEIKEKSLIFKSVYREGGKELTLSFDREKSSVSFVGLFSDKSIKEATLDQNERGYNHPPAAILLPAVLHFADYGSLKLTCSAKTEAYYRAERDNLSGYTQISLLPCKKGEEERVYEAEVCALYPNSEGLNAPEYDGVKRNLLNGLQLNENMRILGNSAAGGPGPFALYFYSKIAALNIKLFDNLSTLDILRQSLERYLSGFKAYGMAGSIPAIPYDFMDSYPSLIIAISDYVTPGGDYIWFEKHYDKIREWADRIISQDSDGDGLLEYPLSGNSYSWPEKVKIRPSNWWDTIGFAHKDAYGNGLAYRALKLFCFMSEKIGRDCKKYSDFAQGIKDKFFDTFYNAKSGLLAGWKSEDGQLHDYAFTFVNSMAVVFELVEGRKAEEIMDALLAKFKEVGYDDFKLGVPGNLISVAKKDYVHIDERWGGGIKEDNSDGFQKYENGGATACFAFYTVEALYKLGKIAEGDKILFPLLAAFEDGDFQGRGDNKMTKDWRTWKGVCYGYELLLADGYASLVPAVYRSKLKV